MSAIEPAYVETASVRASAANVEHLQRVIEKQPGCLMRVSIDGVLLAANDAALELLDARETGQVLERALTEWIVPEHHARWSEFASAVADGASRSLECGLTDMSGLRRTILFHGVPLLDHADGIPSMMLGARDISMLRQLEAAQEAEKAQDRPFPEREHLERLLQTGRKHLEDQRAQLATAAAEQQRLEALLEAREIAYQRLITEHAELQRTLSEQHQLDLHRKTRESQEQCDLLRTQLANAEAERCRVEGLLTESAAKQKQMAQALADHRVELRYLDLTTRQLMPLAAAGRLARELGVDFQRLAEAIDARAANLLAQCPPDAPYRDELEALRGDALRVGMLMCQIAQARSQAPTATNPTHSGKIDVEPFDV